MKKTIKKIKQINMYASNLKAGRITLRDLLRFAHACGCDLIITFDPRVKDAPIRSSMLPGQEKVKIRRKR